MNKRKLKDGTEISDIESPVELTVKTRCPDKWLLIDRESGEAYVAYHDSTRYRWKKLYNAEWTIDA